MDGRLGRRRGTCLGVGKSSRGKDKGELGGDLPRSRGVDFVKKGGTKMRGKGTIEKRGAADEEVVGTGAWVCETCGEVRRHGHLLGSVRSRNIIM